MILCSSGDRVAATRPLRTRPGWRTLQAYAEQAVDVVAIVGVLLGLVLLYFWLKGHWFAAVVAMLGGFWIGMAIAAAPAPQNPHSPEASFFITMLGGAIAWIPYAIHRANRRQPAAPIIAPQPIAGISLVSRDAPFNS